MGTVGRIPSNFRKPVGEFITFRLVRRLITDSMRIADACIVGYVAFQRNADSRKGNRWNGVGGGNGGDEEKVYIEVSIFILTANLWSRVFAHFLPKFQILSS